MFLPFLRVSTTRMSTLRIVSHRSFGGASMKKMTHFKRHRRSAKTMSHDLC